MEQRNHLIWTSHYCIVYLLYLVIKVIFKEGQPNLPRAKHIYIDYELNQILNSVMKSTSRFTITNNYLLNQIFK